MLTTAFIDEHLLPVYEKFFAKYDKRNDVNRLDALQQTMVHILANMDEVDFGDHHIDTHVAREMLSGVKMRYGHFSGEKERELEIRVAETGMEPVPTSVTGVRMYLLLHEASRLREMHDYFAQIEQPEMAQVIFRALVDRSANVISESSERHTWNTFPAFAEKMLYETFDVACKVRYKHQGQ